MNIYFDIETIPCQLAGIKEELAAAVTAPAQFKKPESIAEWLRDNREAEAEQAWLKTSFDGGLGQICCIGWAIDDGAPMSRNVTSSDSAEEADMLRNWFHSLTSARHIADRQVFIGHNSNGFDIPFIWKRSIVLGVKPPIWFPRDPKPWAESTFDTMISWNGIGAKAGGSMDRICKILGIPGKEGMDGSQVWPAFQEGRHDEIAAYCRDDVARTRAMHLRMTFAAESIAA